MTSVTHPNLNSSEGDISHLDHKRIGIFLSFWWFGCFRIFKRSFFFPLMFGDLENFVWQDGRIEILPSTFCFFPCIFCYPVIFLISCYIYSASSLILISFFSLFLSPSAQQEKKILGSESFTCLNHMKPTRPQ